MKNNSHIYVNSSRRKVLKQLQQTVRTDFKLQVSGKSNESLVLSFHVCNCTQKRHYLHGKLYRKTEGPTTLRELHSPEQRKHALQVEHDRMCPKLCHTSSDWLIKSMRNLMLQRQYLRRKLHFFRCAFVRTCRNFAAFRKYLLSPTSH